jgi:hypothetical protein
VENHIPYEQTAKRPCDFIVKYKFITEEKGGRTTLPAQGYRPDFLYAEDNAQDGLWIIWPEFLDLNGNVITDKSIRVDLNGKAIMWIMNEHFTEKHKARIKIGQKGFFMEGSRKVAECEVIEVVGLKSADT